MRYSLVKKILKPIFAGRFKEINGLENLPEKGAYIIAVNHIDYLDGPFISLAFEIKKGLDVYFLSKTKNYWWSAATLPIDSENKTKSVAQAAQYLKEGKIICNFIEGQRNPAESLLTGRTGAVRSALTARVPIVPVGLICRFYPSYLKSLAGLLTGRHKAIINIGRPVSFEEHHHQEITKPLLEELTREVMKKIGSLCQKKYPF